MSSPSPHPNLVQELVRRVAQAEQALLQTRLLAPRRRGGLVRTRIDGLVCTFEVRPDDFEGWGLFEPCSASVLRLIEAAPLARVRPYLERLVAVRLVLVAKLEGRSWSAVPAGAADVDRLGGMRCVQVHLVEAGARFEPVTARIDGAALWFDEVDRRADPRVIDELRAAYCESVPARELHIAGLTLELRHACELAQAGERVTRRGADEQRLRAALLQGGGRLLGFTDRGHSWSVDWIGREGEHHTSLIAKHDLTVVSAGICLDGTDRHFDLQSIVGVVEGFPDDMW